MNLISQDAIDVERWRRIESVLDPALDLKPQEIAAYLDRACAGSPELRAEVEALLEADAQASGFLSVPAAVLLGSFADSEEDLGPRPGAAPSETPSASATPPERVGRYRILGELGRGGMGIVYLGRDEALGRDVAIKALPPPVASDPGRLARFLREARLLGTLHHPGIASIHGIEQADGPRYLILERIEGTTLAETLSEKPLPLAEALDACAQIATALAAAHALGIAHRDLKPGNVMRTPGGLVKVLDFGLAMHVSAAPHDAAAGAPAIAAMESPGTAARLGTPGYMSPEQILGLPQDTRTDLFALGAVLYQCLTGARAFPGTSVYAVIAATLNAPIDATRLPSDTPEAVRALLARTLEKDPSRRLADAEEAAAVLRTAAATRGPVPPRQRGVSTPAARLPETATPFVGREREVAATLGLLERASLVTLTGSAGSGKTRLAIEVSRAAIADETWFADLSAAIDSAAVAAAVATAAGWRDPAESALDEGLAARLGERTGLLVLDNADLAPGPCAALASRLIARHTRLRVLVTAREWLGLQGEQTLRVPPLSLPEPDAPPTRDAAGASEAVRMFVACAKSTPGGFQLTDANAAVVASICRNLDGIPLAIELTAALLRQQSLHEIAADLEQRVAREPTAMETRDALEAAFQLSYERLTDDERRFFRALSVFEGGFGLESATAVCSTGTDDFATLDRLTRLLDKSLVAIQRVDRLEPRYRLLESLRRFGAMRRDAAHETAALRALHLEWFLGVAERAAPSLLGGTEQARCLASLEADHPNLLTALATCESADDDAMKALRLAGSVWLFWYVRGHFARGREALARALQRPGADRPTPARAQALFAAGGLALFQGDFVEGRRLSQAALELYEGLGEPLGVARSLSHLALCASGEGRYPEARDHTERAIAIFRAAGDARRLAATLNNLGMLKRQQGDYRAAIPDYEEALELQRPTGDRDVALVTLVNLGLASVRMGSEQAAGRRVDEALAIVQQLRAKRSGAAALEVAAEVLGARGLVEEGVRLMGAAKALRSQIGLTSDGWWRRTQIELAERWRTALGAEEFERLLAEGGRRTFERAVEDARHRLAPGNTGSERSPQAEAAVLETGTPRRNE